MFLDRERIIDYRTGNKLPELKIIFSTIPILTIERPVLTVLPTFLQAFPTVILKLGGFSFTKPSLTFPIESHR
jgi:hypothetical protein